MPDPILYMLFGYPGAGKTTAALVIARLTGAVHLSSDALRLELFGDPQFDDAEHATLYAELDRRTEELLSRGQSVIYDANLNRRQHRQEKYDICQRSGAACRLIWVEAPRTVAKQRAADTSRQHLWPESESPAAMFDRIADVIEEPGVDEPYVSIDGTNINDDHIRQRLGLV